MRAHYDRRNAEDALQTLGAVFGSVLRIVTPRVSVDDSHDAIDLIDRALQAVAERDANAHLAVGMEFYEMLVRDCPNATLADIAATTLAQLRNRYGRKLEARTPNWELLEHGWSELRAALLAHDPVAAETAFGDMHRLPGSQGAWEPPTWE